MDLTTAARVKALATGFNPTSTLDALIATLITARSAAVEQYLDRSLGYVLARSKVFDVEDGQRIFVLDAFPAIANVAVSSDVAHETTTYTPFGVSTLVDPSRYAINREKGLIEFDSPPSPGPQVLKVVYDGGIDATATTATLFAGVAPNIAYAVDTQVVYDVNKRDDPGVTSEAVGGVSFAQDAYDWLPVVRKILAPYMRVALG